MRAAFWHVSLPKAAKLCERAHGVRVCDDSEGADVSSLRDDAADIGSDWYEPEVTNDFNGVMMMFLRWSRRTNPS